MRQDPGKQSIGKVDNGLRLIDLSHTISPAMAGVQIQATHTLDKDGWNATTLMLFSHSGTHVDAP